MTLCVLTIGIAATGCATAGTETRHGLGVGEWQARLPTTASPIHELAYGRGGSSSPSADALDLDLGMPSTPDDVVQPSAKQVAVAKPAPRRAAVKQVAPVAEATPVAPLAAQPEPQLAAAATDTAPVLLASNDVDARYAQREVQAQEQQKFRGGDAIVISAGAVVVVLLIVILILLLR